MTPPTDTAEPQASATAAPASTDPQPENDEESLVEMLLKECQQLRATVAEQQETIEAHQEALDEYQDTVETQQETIDKQQQTITDQVSRINQLEDRVADLEASAEKTREIAKTAIGKTEQLANAQADSDTDTDTDSTALPNEVEPATSPLDFFANCRPAKVKETFVEQHNRTNTYRAIEVAKRWQEFAQRSTNGEEVFFTRESFETALATHLGESPHRQTISRVWETLADLGGDDLIEKRHRVSATQEPKQLLVMDVETAERLLEHRYRGLEFVESTDLKTLTGGVTPVVTEGTG